MINYGTKPLPSVVLTVDLPTIGEFMYEPAANLIVGDGRFTADLGDIGPEDSRNVWIAWVVRDTLGTATTTAVATAGNGVTSLPYTHTVEIIEA